MNKFLKIGMAVGVGLVVMAGTTHLWLPASSDECQQDISHKDNLWSLAPFHCINHTEFAYVTDADGNETIVWDHLHAWMTEDWFVVQGYTDEEAAEYVATAGD